MQIEINTVQTAIGEEDKSREKCITPLKKDDIVESRENWVNLRGVH